MNRKAAGAEPHLKVVSRPSLYTSDAPASSEKNVSILASLEPERPARTISRTWSLLILMSLLLLTLSYWAYANALFSRPLEIPAWMETALNLSKSGRAVAQPVSRPIVAKLPVETPVEEPRTATIVTEPVAPVNSEPVQAKPVEQLAKLEAEPPKKKVSETQVVSSPVVVEAKPPVQKAAGSEPASNKKVAANKKNPEIAEPAPAAKIVKTDTTKSSKDGDVDLIAALLTRVSRPDPATKEVKPKAVSAPAKVNSNAAQTSGKRQPEPNRDIVARTAEDSTESLLKRCKALGFIEGELCRIRICSKLWGVDPACPVPEQTPLPMVN